MKTKFVYENREEYRMWSEPNEYGEVTYNPPTCPKGVDPKEYDLDMLDSVISGVLKDEFDPFSESLYPYEPKYLHAELYYDEKNGNKATAVARGYSDDGPDADGGLLDTYVHDDEVESKEINIPLHFASSGQDFGLSFKVFHTKSTDVGGEEYYSLRIGVFGYYPHSRTAKHISLIDMNVTEAPFCDGIRLDKYLGILSFDGETFSTKAYDLSSKKYASVSGDFADEWVPILVNRIKDKCIKAFID